MCDRVANRSDEECEDMFVNESEGNTERNMKTKKKKPGIVYLSTIPKYMTAAHLRELLSHYGEVGRVFLQEDARDVGKKGKKKNKMSHSRNYAEGWLEFKSKRVAKEVAQFVNNTHIGGRKKSKFYDCIWTIKYLPRFKWTHLSERLAYEQAVHKQRMRAEIYQAKREADYFSLNVDKSERLKKKLSKGQKLMNFKINPQAEIHQRETEEQIMEKKHVKDNKLINNKKNSGRKESDRDSFLKTLFS